MSGELKDLRHNVACKLFKHIVSKKMGKQVNVALSNWRGGVNSIKEGDEMAKLEVQSLGIHRVSPHRSSGPNPMSVVRTV